MLALAPQLVRMDQARAGGSQAKHLFEHLQRLTLEGVVPTAWLTADLAPDGVIGDPTAASSRTGERIIEHWVVALAEAIDDFRFPASSS